MPAITFFAMLQAGRVLASNERVEECDIAFLPACKFEQYKYVRERYVNFIDYNALEDDPLKPPQRGINAASPEARDAMFAIMARYKSNYGKRTN